MCYIKLLIDFIKINKNYFKNEFEKILFLFKNIILYTKKIEIKNLKNQQEISDIYRFIEPQP